MALQCSAIRCPVSLKLAAKLKVYYHKALVH